jgi:peptide/nickel transport system substrate-binding protein
MARRHALRVWAGRPLALAVGALACLLAPAPARAGETPRAGGTLTFVVGAEPPSYDGHRETSFALIHPIAPHYSTMLRIDSEHYPKIVGDVAEGWTVSADGLTHTFKIRPGIKFHDGSVLTARDVKATYDRIVFPPEDVVSVRKASYGEVEKVEAPTDGTVVFRLKWPSAAFLDHLASPWNFIYRADILVRDQHWYERNIMGSGPFKFGEHVKGSHWVGKKNPAYFVRGRPYLDGYRAIFAPDTSARFAAVQRGRALIEFRGASPAARDDLVKALGNKIAVQESLWLCALTVAVNNERRPFDDARVRRALSLAVDRWEGSRGLSRIAFVKEVGGVLRPGAEFAASDGELIGLAGFSRDIEASRREARRLLKEAGVPDGFPFTFKNRDVKMPYEPMGLFLIDQWRKVGLSVKHVVQETGPYQSDLRNGNFETSMDYVCEFMDEPDLMLQKYLSAENNPQNYSRYNDPRVDELYEKQSRATDAPGRRRLIREFERIVLDEKAYQFPTLWWQRIIPHWARVRGWKITPSHYLGQDLRDVWLGPE